MRYMIVYVLNFTKLTVSLIIVIELISKAWSVNKCGISASKPAGPEGNSGPQPAGLPTTHPTLNSRTYFLRITSEYA